MSQTPLRPKDHAEAVALFRAEVVGALTRRELEHGDLRRAFSEASQLKYRPPKAHGPRNYAASTLERWYYAYKAEGLEALQPKARADRGRGRDIAPDLRELLLEIRALRRHGPPEALYLDNGSTYRGEALSLACARLGVALIHAKPYDAPARGKMERFWRTLREQCLDLTGSLGSLHDLNARLYAWVDERYHITPHGALLGKTPLEVYDGAEPTERDAFDEIRLRDALTVRARRRVRRDNTLSMDGDDWETTLHFLAGRLVTVARCLALPDDPPWIEHEESRYDLRRVDPVANGRRPRSAQNLDTPHTSRVPFDAPGALLDQAVGKRRDGGAS